MRTARRIIIAGSILLCMSALGACRKPGVAGDDVTKAGVGQGSDAGGPFVVRKESEGLLLTWIDEKGDFHVEQKVDDVPMVGRDAVRVVDPNREQEPNRFDVVDLRNPRPDGTFPIRSMTRSDFENLAVKLREKNAPTLASAAPGANDEREKPPSSESGDDQVEPGPVANAPSKSSVIIYGASWCGACHQAAAHLKRKGIAFVEKDIEADPNAAREMHSKLAKAGLRAGSIPVIDVRGKVLVGFDPGSVDAALGKPI